MPSGGSGPGNGEWFVGTVHDIKAWARNETGGMFVMPDKESKFTQEDQDRVDRARKIMTDPPPPGIRHDGGKLKWHLLPVPALLGLVKVFHGGALKYAENQWRGGMKWSRIYRSMISHFLKWLATNNSYDKELGTHHLMMVAWGCFVLYMYEVVYKFTDYDDRPEKGLLTDEDFEFIMGMLVVDEKIPMNLNPLDKDDAARENDARTEWINKLKRGL